MWKKGLSRLRDERGQGLLEYALILVLVAIIVIVLLLLFGDSVADLYCTAVEAIDSDMAPDSCATDDTTEEEEDDEGDINVSCGGPLFSGSNGISMEANVTDNAGESNISSVRFTLNGHSVYEYQYHYCLGGTDNACSTSYRPYSTFGITSGGTYTVNVLATDADGNTGSCSREITVP